MYVSYQRPQIPSTFTKQLNRTNWGGLLTWGGGGYLHSYLNLHGKPVGTAAAAWIAFLVEGDAVTKLASESQYLHATRSSFEAEVIALDLAIRFLRDITAQVY